MSCSLIIQNTKLAIEKSVCANVSDIISRRFANEEVEVRFGHVIDGKNFSGLAGNETETPREIWYRLLNLLNSSPDLYDRVGGVNGVEKTLSESYGSIRKITDLGTPSKTLYQEKKQLKTVEIMAFQVGSNTYNVRLNRASEVSKDQNVSGSPDFSRIRTRVSFVAKNGTHRIDMTYISKLNTYEVEIEYLKTLGTPSQPDLTSFFNPIKLVTHVIKGNNDLITVGDYGRVISEYNSLFINEAKFDPKKIYKRALPQPVNFKSHRVGKMSAYAVTNKLNGTRMIGIILDSALYGINMVGNVVKIASNIPIGYDKTVFDCEYFKGVLYVFDILFEKKQNVRNENLDIRLSRASAIINTLNLENLKLKKFNVSGNLYNDVQDMLQMINNLPTDDNDGIIFVPISLPYFNDGIYKWKPPHMLTIDFMASSIGNSQWILEVVGQNGKLERFTPSGFDGVIESKTDLKGIGEYKWVNGTFELERMRPDKDTPNFITIAQDVWADITNPISEENLLSLFRNGGEDRDAVRKYHNSIKRDLIMSMASQSSRDGKTVVDLGAGKGGDLIKYQSAKIRSLLAVEPNKRFLIELQDRAKKMKIQNQLDFDLKVVNTVAQDVNVISQALNGRKVDLVSMFFSLSFFFENDMTLTSLVNTIHEILGQKGYFIGTTIDGNAVRSQLSSNSEITFGPVKIEKKYRDFTGPIGFGKSIDYIYGGSETVTESQREYLVDWDLFVKRLNDKGITLTSTEIFKPVSWLDDNGNNVSKLYRSFTFQRTKDVTVYKPDEKKVQKLPKADNGKTFIFETDLKYSLNENDQIVRTGTIADGSCFFYAVMQAIKKGYGKLSRDEQVSLVREYRRNLPLSKEKWNSIYNGTLARVGIDGVDGFDTIFWKSLRNENQVFAGRNVSILNAIDPRFGMKNFYENLKNSKYEIMNLIEFKEAIVSVFTKYIKNVSFANDAIAQLKQILEESENEAYDKFVEFVRTPSKWAGQEMLELVGNDINRDIYILDGSNGNVYPLGCEHTQKRKSIILLYQGGQHYECIGVRHPSGVIQREFDFEDNLIQTIRTNLRCED